MLAALTVAPSDRLAMADRLFNRGDYASARREYLALKGEKGVDEADVLYRLAAASEGMKDAKAVRADARMRLTCAHRKPCRITHIAFKAVDQQKIIAVSMHLRKTHCLSPHAYMRSGASMPIRYSPVLITLRTAFVSSRRAAVAATFSSRIRCS